MTRVIHTGDTHIGYRQYHSDERRADFLRAFRSVIDDAIADDVDAVVHAGDLFHSRRPNLTDLLGTIDVLRSLEAASIPFLAIVGNHDRTRDDQWLDLLSRLGLARRLDRTGTVIGDVTFYGLDHVPRSRRDDLSYRFEPADTPHAALVAHGLFDPFPHADWDTETVLEEATVSFDVVLLGDNHVADRARVHDTWVTYCGSTERTSASERADRGYNVVTFDDGVRITRRAIEDTRRFVFVDIDLADEEATPHVIERVLEHDVEDAVVIVTVTGAGSSIKPADIEQAATEAGALVARVSDTRDRDEAAPVEVVFGDPDRAVSERLRSMGLSEVGGHIDEIVRDEAVAESNIRDRVAERTRSAVEADDLEAFRATDPSAESGDSAPTDDEPAEATSGPDGKTSPASDAEVPTRESSETDAPPHADPEGEHATADDTGTTVEAKAVTPPSASSADRSDTSEEVAASSDTDPASDDDDESTEKTAKHSTGQTSMEEYL